MFSSGPEGSPSLYKDCEPLRSHTAPVCFRNTANQQQPGALTRE